MHKLNKTLLSIMSLMLVTTSPVYAAYTESNQNITGSNNIVEIKQYLKLNKNTKVPGYTFEYNIEGIEETIPASSNNEEILKPNESQIPTIKSISFADDYNEDLFTDDEIEHTESEGYRVHNTYVDFSNVTYTTPGNYRYILSEKVGLYDGITYDTTSRYYIDVIVVSDESGKLSISEYTIKETTKGNKVDVGTTNKVEYAKFINTYKTSDLVINNTTSGNQIDHTSTYNYNILVESSDVEKHYKYEITKYDNTTVEGTLESNNTTTISLKEGESITIYGLSENDTYTVNAEDKTLKGYLTQITVETEDGLISQEDTLNNSGTINKLTNVTVLYTKNIAVKTGVILNVLPYILMGILSIITLLSLKKKEDR